MPQRTILLLLLILASSISHGAGTRPRSIDSIRIHATTITENSKLPLTLVTKRDAGIRATIHIPGKLTRAVVLFDGDKIHLIQELTEEGSIKELNGNDAAVNLFEMLMITPEFHFNSEELGYQTSILDQYKVELLRDEIATPADNEQQPSVANLYIKTDSQLKLLRTIKYIDFFKKKDSPYYQPKKITFTDHTNASSGEIIINEVSYNSGIPDFIFKLPESN
jgi:hypothetical protein|tara:strand:- start:3202 stop:3867 length:666 start_codon:yes stop_codon:yes gene_type:complete